MLEDSPGVNDLTGLGIELRSPNPQAVVITMSYSDPGHINNLFQKIEKTSVGSLIRIMYHKCVKLT